MLVKIVNVTTWAYLLPLAIVEWPERSVDTNPINDCEGDQLGLSASRFLRCTKDKSYLLYILLWDTWVAADVPTEESQTNTSNNKQHDSVYFPHLKMKRTSFMIFTYNHREIFFKQMQNIETIQIQNFCTFAFSVKMCATIDRQDSVKASSNGHRVIISTVIRTDTEHPM